MQFVSHLKNCVFFPKRTLVLFHTLNSLSYGFFFVYSYLIETMRHYVFIFMFRLIMRVETESQNNGKMCLGNRKPIDSYKYKHIDERKCKLDSLLARRWAKNDNMISRALCFNEQTDTHNIIILYACVFTFFSFVLCCALVFFCTSFHSLAFLISIYSLTLSLSLSSPSLFARAGSVSLFPTVNFISKRQGITLSCIRTHTLYLMLVLVNNDSLKKNSNIFMLFVSNFDIKKNKQHTPRQ